MKNNSIVRSKLNSREVILSEALIDSYISHEIISISNMLQEYEDIKEKSNMVNVIKKTI